MPEVVGRLRTPRLAAAPASPAVGEVYYDTVANILYWWNGTAWMSASGGTPDLSTVPLLAPATDARNVFSGASGRVLVGGMVTGDTQSRFTLDTGGAMRWGPGNAVTDATLFRNGPGELRTTDTLLAVVRGTTVGTAFSAHVTGDGQRRYLVDARGQHFWGDGTNPTDAVLYRRGAKEMGLLDTWLTVQRTNATDLAYRSLVSAGDTVARLAIDVSGRHDWGPGNAAADVALVRNSPGYVVWTLANGFEVTGGGYFVNRNPNFSTGILLIGSTALSVQAPRITFRDAQATPRSVYLSKSGDQLFAILDDGGNQRVSFDVGSANRPTVLPGSLNLGGDGVSQGVISLGANGYVSARAAAGAGGATFVSRVTGDAVDRFQAYASGQLNWGDGTAATLDVILRRRGVGELATLNALFTSQQAAAGNSALSTLITGEALYRLIVRADGTLVWSDGTTSTDTYLARSAAARLALTGMLTTTLGVATRTKAGVPVDADWATAPPDGSLVVNTSTGTLYMRSSGAWLQAAISPAGFPLLQPPDDARNQFIGDIAARMLISTRVLAAANNTFQLAADGSMKWGLGVAAAPAVTLGYDGSDTLKISAGTLRLVSGSDYGTALRLRFPGDTGTYDRFSIDNDGTHRWGPGGAAGDTTLYRWAVGWLGTDSGLYIGNDQGVLTLGTAVGAAVLRVRVSGDVQNRLQVLADGSMSWGPGGTTVGDTNLYRSGAGVLATAGTLVVGSQLYASNGVANRVAIGANGPAGEAGIRFHSSGDTNLYRSVAGILKTDGGFFAGAGIYASQGGATQVAIGNISGNAGLSFGSANDTNLYRSSAGILRTDGALIASDFTLIAATVNDYSFHLNVAGDTAVRLSIRADGLLYWGPGNAAADVYLYRSAAGQLSCSGSLTVGASLTASSTIVAMQNTAYQQVLGNTYGYPGTGWGAPDTYLYRPAANTLNHYAGAAWGTFNAGAFVVGSDRSIKSDIEPHDVPVDALLRAGIYTYRLKGAEGRHLGLVSDELPDELVSMTADPENKGGPDHRNVDLYKLTTALLATVQHLNERLTTLEESR